MDTVAALDELFSMIDSSPHFAALTHFLHLFSQFIPLDDQFLFNDRFSPVHLRHFFLYQADFELLHRPYYNLLKELPHWRNAPGSLLKALTREYSKRGFASPWATTEDISNDTEETEQTVDSLIRLDLLTRIRIMHDICCIFLPWSGDHFSTFLTKDLGVSLRLEDSISPKFIIIADRFLYYRSSPDTWTILAYDSVSWQSILVDETTNVLLKSRKPADKKSLRALKEFAVNDEFLPELLDFDEKCRRNIEHKLLIDARKRSPRVREREARRNTLENLRTRSISIEMGRTGEAPRADLKNSRAERIARREHFKVISQLEKNESSSQSDFNSEASSTDADFLVVDDVSEEDDEEDQSAECSRQPLESPIKRVILNFRSSSIPEDPTGPLNPPNPLSAADINEDTRKIPDSSLVGEPEFDNCSSIKHYPASTQQTDTSTNFGDNKSPTI